ncbi:FadR/GntR family transcriptional regulator [Rhodococcus koreensis]
MSKKAIMMEQEDRSEVEETPLELANTSPFDMSRAAVFAPIQTMSAFEETVERLLSAVRAGVFAVGERLPSERELADQLQVSRLTLREAIHALQLSGHLKTRRGRYGGTFVTFDPAQASAHEQALTRSVAAQLEDILVMRRVLEVGGVEVAATIEQGPGEIDHLERCLLECEQASDRVTFHRTDSRLHLAFAEMTRSQSLVSALTSIRPRLNVLLETIPALEWNVSNSHRQHRQIMEAIISGDAATAREVMQEHVHGTESLLRGFLAEGAGRVATADAVATW